MEASIISCSKEIQDATVGRKVDVDRLLGLSRAYSRNLSGTWNNCYKCNVLWHASEKLRPAIRSKRRGKLSKEILLLHDNARPHTAAHTLENLKQLKWEAMELPVYSPDLAPSDFHLFGQLKEAFRGRRFSCDDDVKAAVHQWLRAQPKTFFSNGIKKLVGGWEKCIAKQSDYIEKWRNLLLKFLKNRV